MNIKELKTTQEIEAYFEQLNYEKINIIAIDIEGEYNLHCYGEHLCLIQIYDGKNEIIIDPLRFKDENTLTYILKIIFESRKILKIMYDSSSDASLLKNRYKIKINSVLDLRPAVHLLDYDKQSLANILEVELSITPPDKKKFQMYNWMRRPINDQALEYAISDVRYLFELKKILINKLIKRGLLDEYTLMNLMVQNKEDIYDAEAKYYKRKGYSYLNETKKALFRQIYDIRDKYAKIINKPPGMILSNLNVLTLVKNNKDNFRFLDKNVHRSIKINLREMIIDDMVNVLDR
ncbi:MAG: 3'-5' exonuclease [bacterium]|nr:3'-5' exonuclease [bacterium]